MDPNTDLQTNVQLTHPQEQAETDIHSDPSPHAVPQDIETSPLPANSAAQREHEEKQKLRDLSKSFGGIPNVPVFTQWETRVQCCSSAVHRSIIAGICGNKTDGAFSIALSSLYKDDEDGGDVIIYTGTGGRERWTRTDPPKRLRVGPQTMDQTWDHTQNKALIVSFLTGNPVRVIRSWKCPSQYAPIKGLRYDGLYKVSAYWTAKGRGGKNICRCRLERLPGQPPIPERPIVLLPSKNRGRKRLVSPACSPSPSTVVPNRLDFGTEFNESNPPPTQVTGSSEGESEALSHTPQQQAVSTSGTDFIMGDVDVDTKDPQLLLPQHAVPRDVSTLVRYRWDSKRSRLVKVPAPRQVPRDLQAAEREEDCRGEDDVTLVPSEDGHVEPAAERMETEFFSDCGSPPRHETPASDHQGDR